MNCTKRETEHLPGALCPLECALLNLYDGLWVTSFRYSVQLKKYCFHLLSLIYFFWITDLLDSFHKLMNWSSESLEFFRSHSLWCDARNAYKISTMEDSLLLFSVFRFPDATLSQLPDQIIYHRLWSWLTSGIYKHTDPPPPHQPLQFQHRPFESSSFPVSSYVLLDFWCRQLNHLIEVFLRNESWMFRFLYRRRLNIRRSCPWAHLFLYEHYMHVLYACTKICVICHCPQIIVTLNTFHIWSSGLLTYMTL